MQKREVFLDICKTRRFHAKQQTVQCRWLTEPLIVEQWRSEAPMLSTLPTYQPSHSNWNPCCPQPYGKMNIIHLFWIHVSQRGSISCPKRWGSQDLNPGLSHSKPITALTFKFLWNHAVRFCLFTLLYSSLFLCSTCLATCHITFEYHLSLPRQNVTPWVWQRFLSSYSPRPTASEQMAQEIFAEWMIGLVMDKSWTCPRAIGNQSWPRGHLCLSLLGTSNPWCLSMTCKPLGDK